MTVEEKQREVQAAALEYVNCPSPSMARSLRERVLRLSKELEDLIARANDDTGAS